MATGTGSGAARTATSALRTRRAPDAVLAGLFLALVVPLVALQRGGTAGAYDQERYHLPTIARFSGELPWVDLDAVRTATGPSYHYLMAIVHRLVTTDRVLLEVVSAMLSLLFLLAILAVVARFVDRWIALLLVAPLALSPYVLQSGAWLNTDNFAALLVVVSLAASLSIASGGGGGAVAGLAAAAAVSVRQIHLWVLGPLVVAALLARRSRSGPLVATLAWCAPAVAVVLWLVASWGGLTPPAFQEINASRFSPSVAAFTLAIAGIAGVFHLVAVGAVPVRLHRRIVLAATCGALTAVVVPSDANVAAGRTGGGLWKVVERAPAVAERSLLLAVLAAAGAVVLTELTLTAARRERDQTIAVVAALLSFAAAQSATNYVYQRYVEPVTLIVLALLAAIALGRGATPGARRRVVLALAALLATQAAAAAVVVYEPTATGRPFGEVMR